MWVVAIEKFVLHKEKSDIPEYEFYEGTELVTLLQVSQKHLADLCLKQDAVLNALRNLLRPSPTLIHALLECS